ncbi:unnamed protein product [Durusdinium trenchii]|uniref:Uncharacterized protein n=1 Tax=Durusdinium trenchii TaxID=1381693 RepID=A0ABP0R875_9DINO
MGVRDSGYSSDWTSLREQKVIQGNSMPEARYVTSAPVILRRVENQKAVHYEGSPHETPMPWPVGGAFRKAEAATEELRPQLSARNEPQEDAYLPGSVRSSPASTGGLWATPRGEALNQMMQAVQAVHAVQVRLPIQGRSAWTPSNVKAACAKHEAASPLSGEENSEVLPVKPEKLEEKPEKLEAQEATPRPKRLTIPGGSPQEEKVERPKSRSSSIAGTPEVSARKIAAPRRVPDLTDRSGGTGARPDSPKKMMRVRTETLSGYGGEWVVGKTHLETLFPWWVAMVARDVAGIWEDVTNTGSFARAPHAARASKSHHHQVRVQRAAIDRVPVGHWGKDGG